jgi:ABC-type nitrate/sulfonate/bicarbonate transport system substrate-binding protein
MKKILNVLLALIFVVTLSFTGCGKSNDKPNALSVYCPDGAPALSVAKLLADENADFDVNVVVASTINTFVTGETPTADVCIMPVNAAVKLLGNGQTYQMLGTITHGNLFLLKKGDAPDVTNENIANVLIGKKVGVINLANVPGLTFKAILSDKGIPFSTIGESSDEVYSDKVNLVGLADGTQVIPNSQCDYFVVPEPALSTKIKATANHPTSPLKLAGSLQALYGDENGYPQAVVVAKKSVIENSADKINTFIQALNDNAVWVKTASAETGWQINGENIVQAWFSGFYPAEKPQYAIVVLCEGGNSGAVSCAPVFKKICDGIYESGLVN